MADNAVAHFFAHRYANAVFIFPGFHHIHHQQSVRIGSSIPVYHLELTVLLNGRKSFHPKLLTIRLSKHSPFFREGKKRKGHMMLWPVVLLL